MGPRGGGCGGSGTPTSDPQPPATHFLPSPHLSKSPSKRPKPQPATPRAIARYPVAAGWLKSLPSGSLAIKWDAARAGRGAVFVTATARGAPPDVLDGVALQDRRLLPPLKRHSLFAAQVCAGVRVGF